jgi:OmcA/MtrC family decaheme c-type cytochrome
MNRGYCVRTLVFAGLLGLGACGGSDSGTANTCTVKVNAAGQPEIVCPNGTTTPIAGGVDAGANVCTIASVNTTTETVKCTDGTTFVLPITSTATGSACTLVANGDGTSSITCPGGDGGVVTLPVKNALSTFASMSAADLAALDLNITITSITVPATGKPVVAFKALDNSSGNVVSGLPATAMRVALLKLVPATSGNDTWLSYMAANATSVASTETGAAANLVDNGDGTYVYTFTKNVADPANAGTTYDANATHRFAMQISQSGTSGQLFAPVNVVKDFIPATGADVTGKNDKVDPASCLECHSSFRAKAGGTGAFHGGTRYDVRFCVACHNSQRRFTAIPGTGTPPAADLDAPGTVDPTTGAWAGNATLVNGEAFIDMPVYIHKIHMGDQLALTGGTYTAVDKPYEITYPQDVRACDKCHRAPAAQAGTFVSKPSRKACGSCHDDKSFAAAAAIPAKRTAHSGGPQADDSKCATCHPATGAKTQVSIGIFDSHIPSADPGADATWLGGTNANTNAGFMPAAGKLPPGAAKITYDLKAVARDAAKHPSLTFRLVKDGAPVVFNTYAAGTVTEMMDGFVGSPSAYFAFALPQDGISTPADFNATASGYLKTIWNGTATGAGAGTMTLDPATGYYTVTLTGVTIPDTATMLTGGVGYTYSLASTPPLTQINLPAFPYGDGTVIKGCVAGKMCGGLIVTAPDVSMVATDATTSKAYAARRPIVKNDLCLKCHGQLGSNPSFHAGQRNDGATCAFCHRPNQTSGGWSASSSTFIHGIHAASMRTVPFMWHAACPTGTTVADGTCTAANADSFADVTYPGQLNNCQQCHAAGTYDFSAAASAKALPNLLASTVATAVLTADVSTSPYVVPGTDYGLGYATSNVTTGTVNGVACTTAAPCVCSVAAPCEAAPTTLVKSPITAACSTCHDSSEALTHMRQMGGSFYETRLAAKAKDEMCMTCHGPGTVAAIADVHK